MNPRAIFEHCKEQWKSALGDEYDLYLTPDGKLEPFRVSPAFDGYHFTSNDPLQIAYQLNPDQTAALFFYCLTYTVSWLIVCGNEHKVRQVLGIIQHFLQSILHSDTVFDANFNDVRIHLIQIMNLTTTCPA